MVPLSHIQTPSIALISSITSGCCEFVHITIYKPGHLMEAVFFKSITINFMTRRMQLGHHGVSLSKSRA